ncbi:MAG: hypothetical protein WCL02_00820 [bacterium]
MIVLLSSTQSCKIPAISKVISSNLFAHRSATLIGCSINGHPEYFLVCPV